MLHNEILNGEADFPVVGCSSEDLTTLFRLYGLKCGRAKEIIENHSDPDDYDDECARQEAVAHLVPAMKVISTILTTQNLKIVMPIFVEYFLSDPDCLQFLEIMKANNPEVIDFEKRLSKVWDL